ncbi:DUF1206 domain-containing protein [Isoptericola sp. AK164]|uniref:DUF1206 domain-containing protein n=1 Tax=Isoptericola sp. AK164 TaxID=3024246 RepID=UPI00241841A5|nr:DUF1206 domain-containing protein [Isoptericola sp. AK164]
MSSTSHRAEGAARQARNSSAVRFLARAGFAASGLVHLILGWLAVQLALGSSSGSADQSGALRQVQQAPGGDVVLWAVTVGFAALALWQLLEALLGVPGVSDAKEVGARVKAAAKGVLYGVLAVTAARYATGSGSGGGNQEESYTAMVMQAPAGVWLVGAAGLVVVGVGVYHVVKGVRKKFLEDLRGTGGGAVGAAVVRLGQIGYVAKGVALGVLGGLFVAAAVTHDADQAGGLDEALQTIRQQPFGTGLLIVIGIGIAAYGVYSFARARYAKL